MSSLSVRILVVLATGLWISLRWLCHTFVHTVVWLYRYWRQRQRLQVAESPAAPRMVYYGKWLLADEHQCCGRPIVFHIHDGYKPGVELQYFEEETPLIFYSERVLDNETDAVGMALAMHRKLLRGRLRSPRQGMVVATFSSPQQAQDEAA